MTYMELVDWWCLAHGWTEPQYTIQGFMAFPPGAVMPVAMPPLYELIHEARRAGKDINDMEIISELGGLSIRQRGRIEFISPPAGEFIDID